jgi:hypothetical protein
MAKLLTVEEAMQVRQGSSGGVVGGLKAVDEQVITVKLPSKGKHGYPAVVRLRPLKVRDVKCLVDGGVEDEIDYVRRLVQVVQGTVLDEGVDVRGMTIPDFYKLLLAHRVNSVGNEVNLSFVCECRDEVQVVKYDLMKLEEKEIADDYVEPVQVGSIQVRYPRLWGYLPEGKRSFDEVNDYDVLRSVVIGKDVDDLLLSEAKGALEFVKKWEGSYGVQTSVDVPCKYCGKKVSVRIPFFLLLSLW